MSTDVSEEHTAFIFRVKEYEQALLATCFHPGFLLGLFFDLEDGGDMFLRNIGWHSTDYTASYSRS
jgi:hypothetical protein